jgi:hypothetical protein
MYLTKVNYFDKIAFKLKPIIMNYKVKPFIAKVASKGSADDVAYQVQSFIEKETTDGWEFVSCGNIDTHIAGSNGCFGFGSTPSSLTSVMVIVFKK